MGLHAAAPSFDISPMSGERSDMSRRSGLAMLLLLVGALALADMVPSQAQSGATIHITAPGTLSQANTRYVLDSDVSAPGTAFTIGASGITLDLNGHTITYNGSPGDAVYGVTALWAATNGLHITNGSIVQGSGDGYQAHAIYVRESGSLEVDHLNISYQGDDTMAVYEQGSGTNTNNFSVHDNVIRPNGTKRVLNHYGDFAAISVLGTGGNISIINNDIEGTGYQGIHFTYSLALTSTAEITGNTVKMASPVGDGYAIIISSASNNDLPFEIANNTVVQNGRGICVEGNVSDTSPGPGNGTIHDNYVESRESHTPDPSGPGLSTGICIRFGAHNIKVYNNTVKVYAGATAAPGPFPTNLGSDCNARGLKIHAGTYGGDIEVYSNTVEANTQDAGHYASGLYAINSVNTSPNVVFHNNTVTSNSCLVDLNRSDGSGSYFQFISNALSEGASPQGFHSINAGYWTGADVGNIFLDDSWTSGASGDDLLMASSGGAAYGLTVQWYLYLTVKDASGNPVSGAGVERGRHRWYWGGRIRNNRRVRSSAPHSDRLLSTRDDVSADEYL